jgi:small subunit ribosomal protein S9
MASSRQRFTSALHGVARTLNGRKAQPLEQQFQSLRLSPSVVGGTRCLTTESRPAEPELPITAAAEVDIKELAKRHRLAQHARAVPVSASYFSRTPTFNDRYLALDKLARTYSNLPVVSPADAEQVVWKSLPDLRRSIGEPVKATDYVSCLSIIKRLHQIHPDLKPDVVKEALQDFKRDVQGFLNRPNPIPIDKFGRALGVGKRKSSTARAFVVEGDGQVLINGKTLADYFGRVHDRESAVWALHATDRINKYNVWARVEGGGTTGQAEALTLAIAKALIAHEPALKPALRKGEQPTAPSCQSGALRPSLTCRFQPAVSPATQGEWRGRSMAASRPERDLPGSRDSLGRAGRGAALGLRGPFLPGNGHHPCFALCKHFSVTTEPRIIVQYKAWSFQVRICHR